MASKEPLTSDLSAEDESKEKKTRVAYYKRLGKHIFGTANILSVGAYFVAKQFPGQAEVFEAKFEFMHKYQLGYPYLVWYLIYLTRLYVMTNANGARSTTAIERPDQHAYEDATGKEVVMSTKGAKGRFNRAQRALFNMDETLPLFCTGIFGASLALGPVALIPALINAYGRITMANKYKESAQARQAGFMPCMVGEFWTAGLVFLCAMKGLAGNQFLNFHT